MTSVILFSALVVFAVLDMSGILEFPRLLDTYVNTVLRIGVCELDKLFLA